MSDTEKLNRRALTAGSLYLYFANGIVYSSVGPCLPVIGKIFGASLSELGVLYACMFAGVFSADFFGGVLMDVVGEGRIMVASAALMTVGLAVAGFAPVWWVLPVCFLIFGFGLGGSDVGTNALVARVNPDAPARYLGLLHAMFCAGAVMGPFIAGALILRTGDFRPAFLVACVISVIAFFMYVAMRFPRPVQGEGLDLKALRGLFFRPSFMILAAVLFIVMGVEMCMNGWLPTYLKRELHAGTILSSSGLSVFWGGLFAGRFLTSLIVVRVGTRRLMWVNMAGVVVGLALVMAFRNAAVVVAATWLLGLFFGPLFPLVIAIGTEEFPEAPGAATGGIFSVGSFGATVLPPAVAVVAERTSIRIGMAALVPVFALTLLLMAARRKLPGAHQ